MPLPQLAKVERTLHTKASLIAALQALDCPDTTPVMYYDAEWNESPVSFVSVADHTITSEKIILLDQE